LFGHEDVAVDAEAVALAGALEDLFVVARVWLSVR